MTDDISAPVVPTDRLDRDGWTLAEECTETVFELPTMRVRGSTRRYEDDRTRRALAEATGANVKQPVRFVAVTRLTFEPPLPPGIRPAMFAATLGTEARRAFADRLRERGLEDVTRARRERLRLPDRTQVRLWKYTATDPSPGFGGELDLECWVGVWTRSRAAFVVTGGYPAVALESLVSGTAESDVLARSPAQYRDAFFELLREFGARN